MSEPTTPDPGQTAPGSAPHPAASTPEPTAPAPPAGSIPPPAAAPPPAASAPPATSVPPPAASVPPPATYGPPAYGPPPGYGPTLVTRRPRPPWLVPVLTGVAGLVLGLLIGGLGVAAATHAHDRTFGPSDRRGHNLYGPFGGQGPRIRPGLPVNPNQPNQQPSPQPS